MHAYIARNIRFYSDRNDLYKSIINSLWISSSVRTDFPCDVQKKFNYFTSKINRTENCDSKHKKEIKLGQKNKLNYNEIHGLFRKIYYFICYRIELVTVCLVTHIIKPLQKIKLFCHSWAYIKYLQIIVIQYCLLYEEMLW